MFIRVNYIRRNQVFEFDLDDEASEGYKLGDFVIIKLKVKEIEREEMAVVIFIHNYDLEIIPSPDVKLLRKATASDIQLFEVIKKEEKKALVSFEEKIKKYNLDMWAVAVFFSFDNKCADFIFTAKERIDFRELVKDLASTYKKKIFLEQVGTRDRSSLYDGFGYCGRRICCSTWLRDKPPVTMNVVYEQNLFYKDRDKLTGLCGKLKCCLNYEIKLYEELSKGFPPLYSEVQILSSGKKGLLLGRSILDQQVRVSVAEGEPTHIVPLKDIKVIKAAVQEKKREVAHDKDLEDVDDIVSPK